MAKRLSYWITINVYPVQYFSVIWWFEIIRSCWKFMIIRNRCDNRTLLITIECCGSLIVSTADYVNRPENILELISSGLKNFFLRKKMTTFLYSCWFFLQLWFRNCAACGNDKSCCLIHHLHFLRRDILTSTLSNFPPFPIITNCKLYPHMYGRNEKERKRESSSSSSQSIQSRLTVSSVITGYITWIYFIFSSTFPLGIFRFDGGTWNCGVLNDYTPAQMYAGLSNLEREQSRSGMANKRENHVWKI